MSVCPFEKIALDDLDRRVLRQLSGLSRFGRRFVGAAGLGGRLLARMGAGTAAAGGGIARATEAVADSVVRHPTRSLLLGVPLAYGAYRLPDRADRALNNVSPENLYKY